MDIQNSYSFTEREKIDNPVTTAGPNKIDIINIKNPNGLTQLKKNIGLIVIDLKQYFLTILFELNRYIGNNENNENTKLFKTSVGNDIEKNKVQIALSVFERIEIKLANNIQYIRNIFSLIWDGASA